MVKSPLTSPLERKGERDRNRSENRKQRDASRMTISGRQELTLSIRIGMAYKMIEEILWEQMLFQHRRLFPILQHLDGTERESE